MAEGLFARKRPERLEGRGFTSTRSIKKRVESAEPCGPNVCHPLAPGSIKTHPFDAARRHMSLLDIPRIFFLAGKPEVLNSVVVADSIGMINREAARYASMHVDPCQPVRVLLSSKQAHFNVPVDLVYASTWFANHVPTLGPYRADSDKPARIGAVAEERRNRLARRLCAGASHTK